MNREEYYQKLKDEPPRKIHGLSHSRLWVTWYDMKRRCYDPNCKAYKNYGGRGIKVSDDWLDDFMNFYNWAINNGYQDNLTLDRIKNFKDYTPNNCRWVSKKVQARNRRSNHLFTINGESKCLSEWCEIYQINRSTVQKRIRNGMDIYSALTKPLVEHKRRWKHETIS